MRLRTAAWTILVAGGAAMMLAGCSSRPEKSPYLNKKFAEMDKQTETIERLSADVRLLNDRVLALVQENEQLKAFLPDVDGQSAVDKISTLEARVRQVESMAASGVLSAATTTSSPASAPASTTASATQDAAPTRPMDLVSQPLAVPAKSTAPVVAAQQQAPAAPAPSSASSFRAKTAAPEARQTVAAAPAPKATTTATASKPSAPAPAPKAAAPARNRGGWHTIAAGDTVESIAAKHNSTPQAVSEANKLPRGARLAIGQRLFIPAGN